MGDFNRPYAIPKPKPSPSIAMIALASVLGYGGGSFRHLARMPSRLGARSHPRSQAFRVGAWAGDGVLSKRRIKPRVARTR